jgi:methyl-accepting chemotaxis protein
MSSHAYNVSPVISPGSGSEYAESNSFFNKLFHSNKNGNGKNLLEKLNTLKACLDNLQMNVFVSDKDLNLIFMNEIARKTIASIEPELRQEFGIGVDELLGGSIHRFHKDSGHVEKILKNPVLLPHTAELAFGNVILKTSIHGVQDENGDIQGYIASWEEIAGRKKLEQEQALVKSMMESAPFNILYCDRDLVLHYANPASIKTLKTLEQYLPVRVDELVGKSIDIFHKNPTHQRKMLSDPRNLPHTAKIQLGPEVLDLVINAIYDNEKNYSGVMVNWSLITDQLKLQREKEEMIRTENERTEDL